jgi:hypothetical protein
MKRSKKQPDEQPDGTKKLRQCLIGRTKVDVLEVVGADGWLGKGATVNKVLRVITAVTIVDDYLSI